MNITSKVALASMLTVSAALSVSAWRPTDASQAFSRMPKARAEITQNPVAQAKLQQLKSMTKAPGETSKFAEARLYGFLDSPDGADYFYVGETTMESIKHDYYVENNFKAFKITIYDDNLQVVGSIEDEVDLGEEYGRCNSIQVAPLLTRKFFNYDNNIEVMVAFSYQYKNNPDGSPRYGSDMNTKVYSIGKKGAVYKADSYYVNAINTEPSSFGENFYITFIGQDNPEEQFINNVLNAFDYTFSVYRKAGYDSNGQPKLIGVMRYPQVCTSGENAIDFVATVNNGKAYFALNHLKYSFFENPYDINNENLTADNQFIISLFQADSSNFSMVKQTVLPCEKKDDSPGSFYYLGNFDYDNDIRFGYWNSDDTLPCYMVTRQSYVPGSDDYLTDYYVVDTDGNEVINMAEGISGITHLSPIPGFDDQFMYIMQDSQSAGNIRTLGIFVNTRTGQEEAVVPFDLGQGYSLNTGVDRVPVKGSYQYVVSQISSESDAQGNAIHPVVFVNQEGEIDHVDRLNIGKDVAMAQVNIYGPQLDPYIFNSDADREYQVLLKRYIDKASGSSESVEEFCIVSPSKGILKSWSKDETMGDVSTAWLTRSVAGKYSYAVVYSKKDANNIIDYTVTFTDLPLEVMAGDGTAENPYKIASIGDLSQMRLHPDAHFELAADIDGQLSPFTSIPSFTGSLDGKNHNISNLTLSGSGIFTKLEGEVKNLRITQANVVNPESNFGIIASQASGASISNVLVYETDIISNAGGALGGLVGTLNQAASISASAMFECEINAKNADVGGLVGKMNTNSSISNSVFTGVINGGNLVGGIASEMTHRAAEGVQNLMMISSCHVDAQIEGSKTIGGIVGALNGLMGERPRVANCHVEGLLKSTHPDAAIVGGIAGSVAKNYDKPTSTDPVVYGNLVTLTAIQGQADMTKDETALVHRIVGKSSFNEPQVTLNNQGEIIATSAPVPDPGLMNNYAISTLEFTTEPTITVFDGLAGHATPDGENVQPEGLNADFYSQLGFKFGTDNDNPWKENSLQAPEMWFEQGVFMAAQDVYDALKNEPLTISFKMVGKKLENFDINKDFMLEFDPTLIQKQEVSFEEDNQTILITFMPLAEGTATVKATCQGQAAETMVKITAPGSGVTAIEGGESTLTYEAGSILGEGLIEIYNLQGLRVATGYKRVNVSHLSEGIYIARSAASTLKFSRR